MKRRTAIRSLLGAPALAPALAAQTPPASNAPVADDQVKLDLATADAVADPRHRFFNGQQFATLARLGDLVSPAYNGKPSAKDAETPQFLDFLLSQSPSERQVLYAQGLDQLDINARAAYGKGFGELSDREAGEVLAPMRAVWTWKAPADPLARFLREAKNDIMRATASSKAWAEAGGSRRAAGLNTYWDLID